MDNQFERSELLFGSDAIERFKNSRVAVFGVGGVGGYVAEALARTGIGTLDLIDNDTVNITNINRQIVALHSTLGRNKTEVMKERIADINPDCKVNCYNIFLNEETLGSFPFDEYDYVVDAIDTVKSKILLAEHCTKLGIPFIASMGAGNKLDPCAFEIADLSKTSVDPLAKILRKELGKRGIKHINVVYSKEQPKPNDSGVIGSNAFVPSAAGLIIASKVINDIWQEN